MSIRDEALDRECAIATLQSLAQIGEYSGKLYIFCSDDTWSALSSEISKLHLDITKVTLNATNGPWEFQTIEKLPEQDVGPIIFIGNSIIIDTVIADFLQEAFEATGASLCSESDLFFGAENQNIKSTYHDNNDFGNRFGLSLCKDYYSLDASLPPCASDALYAFPTAREASLVIAGARQAYEKSPDIKLGFQPHLNYALARFGRWSFKPTQRRCVFLKTIGAYPEVPIGWISFERERPTNRKKRMAKYLEITLSNRNNIDRSPANYDVTESVLPQRTIENSEYIFIITSALRVNSGVLVTSGRFSQTLETIQSIRYRAPGATIILADSSEYALEPEQCAEISAKVDMFIQLGQSNPGIQISGRLQRTTIWLEHEKNLQKALCETYILINAFMNILTISRSATLKRIFKISGRYKLSEGFDLNFYEDPSFKGKFIFLRRKRETYGGCYETRLWSVCESRLAEMPEMLTKIYSCLLRDLLEAERAYFKQLSTAGVAEVTKICVEGEIASNGYYHSE